MSASVWILVFAAWSDRPATVVAQYSSEAACQAAVAFVEDRGHLPGSWAKQIAFCLKGEKP